MRRAAATVLAVSALGASVGATSSAFSAQTSNGGNVFEAAASFAPLTCTLTPSADTYAAQDDGSQFGSATSLHVQSYETVFLVLPTPRNRRSFVKFDLSSCSIPAAAEVVSATLSVFLSSAPNQNRTWNIARITGSWVEDNVDWPGPAATVSTSLTTGTTSNVTLSADVTSNVASFVSGSQPNHGWLFSDSSEDSSNQRNGQFRSREHATVSQRPTLVIAYHP